MLCMIFFDRTNSFIFLFDIKTLDKTALRGRIMINGENNFNARLNLSAIKNFEMKSENKNNIRKINTERKKTIFSAEDTAISDFCL